MTKRDIDDHVAEIASRQAGAFSLDQVRSAGGDDGLARRRVAAGQWTRPAEQVLVLRGAPSSFEQKLWVAVLDQGSLSVVSHESAARLHGLVTFTRSEVLSLTVQHGGRRTPLARCHQTRRPLEGVALATLPGLLVSSVAACIVELSTVCSISRVRVVLDESLANRDVRLTSVVDRWLDARSRGLRVRALGPLLAERGSGRDIPTSELNRLLRGILDRLDGPPATYEAAFPGQELPGCLVDGLLMPERIIVEGDGRRWHTRVKDFARDRERDRAAARAGCITVRYTYDEMAGRPDMVLQELTALRAQRRRDLALPPLVDAA